jgi:DNA invertase Pin-like site-specific DNA recombinase
MATAEKTCSTARSNVAPENGPRGGWDNATPVISRGSPKIQSRHFEKLAIVYVRQSSPQQVLHHRESRARQYALKDYAQVLGWPSERVIVIDEDQGQSGTLAENRTGFQRLIAEVTMDHVGIVLGLELNRLSRSSKDWHQLFELCGVFGTLLADQEGVYDANDGNDRLILGLKGIMSEMELQTMRNRLEYGRLNKAQRGELFYSVPLGYVLLPNGKVEFDPDQQARSVVHLLFEKFEELRSVRGVFYWLVAQGIKVPYRVQRGPRKGELEWRCPSLSTLNQVFHHPIYAGAYAYGRRPPSSQRSQASGKPRSRRLLLSEEWQVLIRDLLPAYITWERYLQNGEQIRQNHNRPDTRGAPRNGRALLCGLLFCGECGWRMQVTYRTADKPHYDCQHHQSEAKAAADSACSGLSGNVLDELVSQQVLRVLEQGSLELSLRAQADVRRERERLDRQAQQNLKRARYDAELAERRYRAVDPDNRLVAATLERQWEQALRGERELQEQYDRAGQQTRPELTPEEEARILALASDIPALWHSPETTNADRQAIIRCLVERVVVHVERHSEHVEVVVHWAGGYQNRLELVRPVRWYDQLRDVDHLKKRVAELHALGRTAAQTAAILNAEGFAAINPTKKFTGDMVRDLRLKLGLRREQGDASLLGPDEWWVRDLAQNLKMPWQTLREWAIRGWAHGRQTPGQKLWLLWADQEEITRLRKLRDSTSHGILGYSSELTTPKLRPERP